MNGVRMKILLQALAGLDAAAEALESLPYGTPQREAFYKAREAAIYLRVELGFLPPVEVIRDPDENLPSR